MKNPIEPHRRIDRVARRTLLAFAGCLAVSSASSAVTASISPEASFPGSPDFRTYDPAVAGIDAERTISQTVTVNRVITQTFQLGSAIDVGRISLLYERGKSGTLVQVWVFPVANTAATSIQTDFDNAVANGFLLDAQFAMPTTPDEDKGLDGGVDRTLTLTLSGDDVMSLAATAGSAGYAIAFQAVDADGTTDELENAFTWRFREVNPGGPYAGGRLYHDTFAAGSTVRDGSLALAAVPEPATFGLTGLGALTLLGLLRRRC